MPSKKQLVRRRKRRNEQRRETNQARRKTTAQQGVSTPERARYMTQLEFLRGRGAIMPEQYKAGDRLYRDWHAAGSAPCVVPRYGRQPGLPASVSGETQIDARTRFDRAMDAVGIGYTPILRHVCLLDGRVSDWGTSRLEGLPMLREGLDLLAGWYGNEVRQHSERQMPLVGAA